MGSFSDLLAATFSWTRKNPVPWILITVISWIVALGWEQDGMRPSIFIVAILMTAAPLISVGYFKWRQHHRYRGGRVVILLVDVSCQMSNYWSEVVAIVERQRVSSDETIVGLWPMNDSTDWILKPGHYSTQDILGALDPLPGSEGGEASLTEVVERLVPKFDKYPVSMRRQLVVLTDSPVTPRLTPMHSAPNTRDIIVEGYDVRVWRLDRKPEILKPEILVLWAREKKTLTAIIPWILIPLLLLTTFRCPVGRTLGFSEQYHRTFSEVLPITIDKLSDGVGTADVLSGGESRSVEALHAAYLDAMAEEPNFASLRQEFDDIEFESATSIAPWVARKLPAEWLILSEDVTAGWLDCCARAHVILARTQLPESSEPKDIVVDLISRKLAGRFEVKGLAFNDEGESRIVTISAEELEEIVRQALGDEMSLRQRLATAGIDKERIGEFDYLWTTEELTVERFTSGEFMPNSFVYLGLLAVGDHLINELQEHPVLGLEIVAVGYADRESLKPRRIEPAAYASVPYQPDSIGCPPNLIALGDEVISPGGFVTIPYAPLGSSPWPNPAVAYSEPIFSAPITISTPDDQLKDNCRLSFLRGYDGVRILSEHVTGFLKIGAEDRRFRFGYSGKGTTNLNKDAKELDRRVTFFIRYFQAGPPDLDSEY